MPDLDDHALVVSDQGDDLIPEVVGLDVPLGLGNEHADYDVALHLFTSFLHCYYSMGGWVCQPLFFNNF